MTDQDKKIIDGLLDTLYSLDLLDPIYYLALSYMIKNDDTTLKSPATTGQSDS